MKKNLTLLFAPFAILVALLMGGYELTNSEVEAPQEASLTVVNTSYKQPVTSAQAVTKDNWIKMNESTPSDRANTSVTSTQEMIDYAMSLIGTPYIWAGETPTGFDCSGFITHVYNTYNVSLPHSSAMQSEEGVFVNKNEAAPGDLVIFTGTNPAKREPGHVGIVISEPGDTISFVHSSSNGGVKVSKVQGSGYDVRFLEVRRVL